MTLRSSVFETAGAREQLDEWMNLLLNVRIGCLASAIEMPEERVRYNVAGVVDTLARGFLAQAFLYRADAQKSKKALCRSFKAAAISNKLAGMPRRVDFSDYQQFLKSSLATNGSAISKFRFKQDTIDNLRASREQVEALGEGVCSDSLGNASEQWIDGVE
jgi:hypothetical protein